MIRLATLLAASLFLTGCTQGQTGSTSDSAPIPVNSKQMLTITVNGISIECEDVDSVVYVALDVRNDSSELLLVNSYERETNLEVKLLNENGRGFKTNDALLSEEIEAGAEGEVYAAFSGLFLGGFDGTFNQVQVLIDGKIVSEKETEISPASCG